MTKVHRIASCFLILIASSVQSQPHLGNAKASDPVAVKDEEFSFDVDVSWEAASYNGSEIVYWRVMRKDGSHVESGSFSAASDGALVTSFGGSITDSHVGKNRYHLEASFDNTFSSKETTSKSSFLVKVVQGPVTLLPPLMTIVVAATTRNVLLSLFVGTYFAALIIWNYNPFYAFINTFSDLLVSSFSDTGHIFIILFTWILSGMITCILKSGGGAGLVNSLSKYATTARAGALMTFSLGLMIFFDDYANTLIVGQTVRPITDLLGISREKLSFLVDATSAPVASISPISSWIGFELSLIDEVLADMTAAGEDLSCYDSSSFIIFINSIPSMYYGLIMLSMQFFVIVVGREFGPMVEVERQARSRATCSSTESVDSTTSHSCNQPQQSTGRGGDVDSDEEKGSPEGGQEIECMEVRSADLSGTGEKNAKEPEVNIEKHASIPDDNHEHMDALAAQLEPRKNTPKRWYNAVVPIVMTIVLVLVSLICTGVEGCKRNNEEFSVQNIFGYSDSFVALLYGSVGGTMTIWIMCWVERVTPDGELTVVFTPEGWNSPPLMSPGESLEVFIIGLQNLVEALMVLLLAWTVGDAFTKCGTGIYISSALADNLDAGAYPALTFLISAVLAMVTGSSWGTMSIMFPLIVPTAHYADPCNKAVFYGTIASILSGAVFGDHCSPISDTTVLAAVACKCTLLDHVKTQIPYAVLAAVAAVVMGLLPAGYGAYHPGVGVVLGVVFACGLFYLLSTEVHGDKKDKLQTAYDYVMIGLGQQDHIKKNEEKVTE